MNFLKKYFCKTFNGMFINTYDDKKNSFFVLLLQKWFQQILWV